MGRPEGILQVGNYTLLECVGQGTFGEVMLGIERHTRESVAVKILEREKITDADSRQRLANEIEILHRVHHANLLQLLEVIEEVDRIYLVTEYIGGGELFNYIVEKGRLEEAEAARLFVQMVAAVDSCHRSLVIHRDLKPENVLLDASGEIKVIDFGLGTVLAHPDEVLQVACGSPHYAAPEMLLGEGYLGARVDMWSLGVCLYAMLCGCLPFDEPEMDVLYDRIIAGSFDFSPAPRISPAAKDLICGLLRMPPDERLTARAVMNHKWLRAAAPSPPATLGLTGAVLDPACKQLLRKLELDFGFARADVLEALRRGERTPATAVYWLLRQRELRRGTVQRYTALLPRPPPPRQPSQRRRPVPANLRAAATKLQQQKPPLPTLPLANLTMTAVTAPLSAREHAGPMGGMSRRQGPLGAKTRADTASAYVHHSGALTDRSGPAGVRGGMITRSVEQPHAQHARSRWQGGGGSHGGRSSDRRGMDLLEIAPGMGKPSAMGLSFGVSGHRYGSTKATNGSMHR